MCMCIVFAFLLIRVKEVRIGIEVKRSEENYVKWWLVTFRLWRCFIFTDSDIISKWECFKRRRTGKRRGGPPAALIYPVEEERQGPQGCAGFKPVFSSSSLADTTVDSGWSASNDSGPQTCFLPDPIVCCWLLNRVYGCALCQGVTLIAVRIGWEICHKWKRGVGGSCESVCVRLLPGLGQREWWTGLLPARTSAVSPVEPTTAPTRSVTSQLLPASRKQNPAVVASQPRQDHDRKLFVACEVVNTFNWNQIHIFVLLPLCDTLVCVFGTDPLMIREYFDDHNW